MNYDVLVDQIRAWSDETAGVLVQVEAASELGQEVTRRLAIVISEMREVADDLERESAAVPQ